MIAVENEEINWKHPKTDTENWVAKEIDWLLQNKKFVEFERRISKFDQEGVRITRPGKIFELTARRTDPVSKRLETWKFVDTRHYNADKKIYPPMRVREEIDIQISVHSDVERAFFYYFIMKDGLGRLGYVVKDLDQRARDVNYQDSLKFAAGNIILNQLSEESIDLRCNAYGVSTVDKSLDLKKRDLFDKIQIINSDPSSRGGYEKFIDEAKQNSPELILRAGVYRAINSRSIVVEGNYCKYSTGELICEIPPQDFANRVGYITEYLMMNDEKKAAFTNTLGISLKSTEPNQKTDYRSLPNPAQIKKVAKDEYGIPAEEMTHLKTKVKLIEFLDQKLSLV